MDIIYNAHHLLYWLENGSYNVVSGLIDHLRQDVLNLSLWEKDEEAFDVFKKTFRHKKALTSQEECDLMLRYRLGDENAFWTLVKYNIGYVIRYAKKYQNHGVILNDLIGEGIIGLIEACQRWDETRGFRLMTFANTYIQTYLHQAINHYGTTIRLPYNIKNALYKISLINERHLLTTGYSPIWEEIEEAKKFDESILWFYENLKNISFSLDGLKYYLGEEENVDDAIYNLKIADPEDTIIYQMDWLNECNPKIAIDVALKTLYEREREILKMYFGIGCQEMSLEEIGIKFDLTKERIRQIKEKAIGRLRNGKIKEGERIMKIKDYLCEYL